ncbi:MAG: SRPBCC family protein, partial [Pseudomonadota bacterium]
MSASMALRSPSPAISSGPLRMRSLSCLRLKRALRMAEVYRSEVIGASAQRVWSIVRDFNALPRWTPFVAASRIEGGMPADRIGCIR